MHVKDAVPYQLNSAPPKMLTVAPYWWFAKKVMLCYTSRLNGLQKKIS